MIEDHRVNGSNPLQTTINFKGNSMLELVKLQMDCLKIITAYNVAFIEGMMKEFKYKK